MSMLAGTYYIGDLCYVMHEEWGEVCDLIIKDRHVLDGEFNLADGRRFAIYSTTWGDGLYRDGEGREYPVDAGSIGCILVDHIRPHKDNDTSLGNIVSFDKPFGTFSDDGKIMFGRVCIDTKNDTEDEVGDWELYDEDV